MGRRFARSGCAVPILLYQIQFPKAGLNNRTNLCPFCLSHCRRGEPFVQLFLKRWAAHLSNHGHRKTGVNSLFHSAANPFWAGNVYQCQQVRSESQVLCAQWKTLLLNEDYVQNVTGQKDPNSCFSSFRLIFLIALTRQTTKSLFIASLFLWSSWYKSLLLGSVARCIH